MDVSGVGTQVLSVENLTKIYPNGKKANDGINLAVFEKEIVGVIGPNGAGKTTMLRQILGLLKPTEGKITLLGKDITEDPLAVKGEVGYEPQYPLYYPSLTIEEEIGFALKFKGYKGEAYKKKLDEIVELLNLGEVRKYFGYQLSPGLVKLSLLAVALAQGGQFLILDEPTSMVDIVTKMHIWDVFSKLSEEQSILIASHDMNEVKRLCDRIYILVNGRIVAQGSPEQISNMLKLPCTMRLTVLNAEGTKKLLEEKQVRYSMEDDVFSLSVDSLNAAIELIGDVNSSFSITYIELEAPSFDEAVIRLMGDNHG
jgi:ABC-2 type transport system ATP-binding protein